MKRWVLIAFVLSCKTPSAAPKEEAPMDASPKTEPPAEPTTKAMTNDERARDVVTRWNAAHAARDAKALGAIYADNFMHYGTPMTREQGVKTKEAAFAAAPDFTQTIGTIEIEPGLGKDLRIARFTKTVTQKGQTNSYPAALKIVHGEIIDENDDVDWCLTGELLPSERKVPPFTMSAVEASRAAMESKHVKEQRKKRESIVVDVKGFTCARACVKPEGECGFRMRTSDVAGMGESNLVEWLRVDPKGKKLWWQDGEKWSSEPLPDVTN